MKAKATGLTLELETPVEVGAYFVYPEYEDFDKCGGIELETEYPAGEDSEGEEYPARTNREKLIPVKERPAHWDRVCTYAVYNTDSREIENGKSRKLYYSHHQ